MFAKPIYPQICWKFTSSTMPRNLLILDKLIVFYGNKLHEIPVKFGDFITKIAGLHTVNWELLQTGDLLIYPR